MIIFGARVGNFMVEKDCVDNENNEDYVDVVMESDTIVKESESDFLHINF